VIAFSVFAQVLLPIIVVVASGYVLQRRLELDLHSVNRVSLYLLSPALIFSSLVQLLRMPQIYAVLAALAFRLGGVRLDPMGDGILNDVFRGVDLVADAAVPLLLIILGLQLAETGRISEGPKVALGTALRLGLSVPLAVGLSYLLNLDELSTKLAIMLSSMPTAVNVTILAIEFNVRPRFVSSVVVVSTAASVFTLTLILVLLGVG
jgi:malate permease and related proteins